MFFCNFPYTVVTFRSLGRKATLRVNWSHSKRTCGIKDIFTFVPPFLRFVALSADHDFRCSRITLWAEKSSPSHIIHQWRPRRRRSHKSVISEPILYVLMDLWLFEVFENFQKFRIFCIFKNLFFDLALSWTHSWTQRRHLWMSYDQGYSKKLLPLKTNLWNKRYSHFYTSIFTCARAVNRQPWLPRGWLVETLSFVNFMHDVKIHRRLQEH